MDVFNGTPGNGGWSLNVAGLALGGTITLQSQSIALTAFRHWRRCSSASR